MGVPVDLNEILSGFFSSDAYNANNTRIEEALAKALDRTGASDNAMEVDLDLGDNNIFNLKSAILAHQAVPLQQVRDLLSASSTEVTSLVDIEDRYIADGGETEIVLEQISYTPATNSLMVFKNGEYQRAGLEYLETGTDRIEFAVALTAADEVDIFGSRYDAQQYVDLAITAANNAEASEDSAEASAAEAEASAEIATSAAGYKLDINDQAGTSYTLQLTDEGDFIRMDNAAANTVIIPESTGVDFEIGTIILVRQIGEGTTTLQPAIGVTLNAPFNNYEISESDFGVAIVKVAANEWDMVKAFGGVDTSDLVAFTQEFDARLQEFYTELLSADPTFVVNFDALQNNVNNAIDTIQSEFATLESNTNQAVTDLTAAFGVIDDDFTFIGNQFDTIQTDFTTIQNDFVTLQDNFDTINTDFTSIQSDWTGIDQRFTDLEDTIDTLNLDGTFENALFTDGYQKIPGGLIMQWGSLSVAPWSTRTADFPIPFPTACLNVTTSAGTNTAYLNDSRQRQQTIEVILSFDNNSVNFRNMRAGDDTSGTLRTTDVYWFAIGY